FSLGESLTPAQAQTYEFDSLTCTGTTGATLMTTAPGPWTFGVPFQGSVQCEVRNRFKASVTITKATSPAAFNQDFGFASSARSFTLNAATIPSTTIAVAPGSFVVAESPVPNWTLTGVTCVGATGASTWSPTVGASLEVVAGQQITCTFTNTAVSPRLTLNK